MIYRDGGDVIMVYMVSMPRRRTKRDRSTFLSSQFQDKSTIRIYKVDIQIMSSETLECYSVPTCKLRSIGWQKPFRLKPNKRLLDEPQ